MKVSELFEAEEVKEIGLDEVKIEDLGDGKFKVSVGPSAD